MKSTKVINHPTPPPSSRGLSYPRPHTNNNFESFHYRTFAALRPSFIHQKHCFLPLNYKAFKLFFMFLSPEKGYKKKFSQAKRPHKNPHFAFHFWDASPWKSYTLWIVL